ncbi:hypothetical protein CPB84DRAFT_1752286 [Gymnopilus junonius]|uniref:Uncharacterized protein n=1 Tax=Gymnopilus junonius TaxID=109634 RepID=A0A9P5NDG0_GYMJU|nr:hypothetical protein CPB84DRAFT_1752286 [Gymnopilus junonius]
MTRNCSRKQQGPSYHSGPKTGLNFHGDYGATTKDSWTSVTSKEPLPGINIPGFHRLSATAYQLSLPQNLEYPYRPRQVILTATQIQSILDYDASLRSASDEELNKLKNGIDFPCPAGLQDFINTLDNQTEEDRSLAFFRVNGHGVYIPEGEPFHFNEFQFELTQARREEEIQKRKVKHDTSAQKELYSISATLNRCKVAKSRYNECICCHQSNRTGSTTNKPTTSTSASTPLSAAAIATAAAISDVEYDSDSPNDPINFDEVPLPFMTEQASGSGVGDSTWEPDNLGDEDHDMDAEGDEEYPTNDELANDDNTATSI